MLPELQSTSRYTATASSSFHQPPQTDTGRLCGAPEPLTLSICRTNARRTEVKYNYDCDTLPQIEQVHVYICGGHTVCVYIRYRLTKQDHPRANLPTSWLKRLYIRGELTGRVSFVVTMEQDKHDIRRSGSETEFRGRGFRLRMTDRGQVQQMKRNRIDIK